ncbi:GntR family transcriptional regulator [Enterobacillus tribolii]|uniref:DNA-binding GntR family transcriptional regulator n=1 Tax=Enterobacillus tribolii TaxID=1487935 RepID=A0A370R391_9GAMM|nr:GntR family transcriptional regulator [Enterobacillus tribolii]MBW7983962.1 GntR family transcriptional regulator [Enterobacillus tribolii]RDK96900.1 DNA-binding GntR family transcriptional regulator [Enterobacillus tribolii]
MSAEINAQLLEKLQDDIANTGSMPLYLRFNESVREAIEQGLVRPGDFLPSERAFTDALGISRITVRKALACLEQDNIIDRGRGFGTQIKPSLQPPLAYSLANIKGFSSEASMQGRVPGSVWLKREKVTVPDDIAELMGLPAGSQVYLLERIRTIDQTPVSFAISYIAENVIDDPQDIDVSLYDYLHKRQVQFGKLSSHISATLADAELRSKLLLKDPCAILVIRQTLMDNAQNPLEHSISYCRGDMYEYTMAG